MSRARWVAVAAATVTAVTSVATTLPSDASFVAVCFRQDSCPMRTAPSAILGRLWNGRCTNHSPEGTVSR